jgi:hypothetical protein
MLEHPKIEALASQHAMLASGVRALEQRIEDQRQTLAASQQILDEIAARGLRPDDEQVVRAVERREREQARLDTLRQRRADMDADRSKAGVVLNRLQDYWQRNGGAEVGAETR